MNSMLWDQLYKGVNVKEGNKKHAQENEWKRGHRAGFDV